jgi:molybdopterin synthase sulfur carrier subunit
LWIRLAINHPIALRDASAQIKQHPFRIQGDIDMAITVRIPTPLRTLTQGKDEVEASGKTVREIIENLEKNYPGLRERLLDDKGVRRFVNIYQNEEDIRFLDSLDTAVKDGDSISIVPAIAGGR